MHLLLRVMGYIAGLNASWARQSVNFIPVNLGVMVACALFGGVGGAIGWRDRDPTAIPYVLIALLIGLPLAISTFKSNIFFRRQSDDSPPVAPRAEDALLQVPFNFTGQLRLHEKEARRFLNVPAGATRLQGGALAFVSNIDASTRFSGIVTKSKVGLWISMPQFDVPLLECGTLYYGQKPQAALRVAYIEGADAKAKRVKAILSFENPLDRDAMRDFLMRQSELPATPLSASPFSN